MKICVNPCRIFDTDLHEFSRTKTQIRQNLLFVQFCYWVDYFLQRPLFIFN
jgi:hypothetical protein